MIIYKKDNFPIQLSTAVSHAIRLETGKKCSNSDDRCQVWKITTWNHLLAKQHRFTQEVTSLLNEGVVINRPQDRAQENSHQLFERVSEEILPWEIDWKQWGWSWEKFGWKWPSRVSLFCAQQLFSSKDKHTFAEVIFLSKQKNKTP